MYKETRQNISKWSSTLQKMNFYIIILIAVMQSESQLLQKLRNQKLLNISSKCPYLLAHHVNITQAYKTATIWWMAYII